MKLFFCPLCQDLRKALTVNTFCQCGESGAKYIDESHAEYWGQAIPIGIDNYGFTVALHAVKVTEIIKGLDKDQEINLKEMMEFKAFTITGSETFQKRLHSNKE